MVHLIIIFQRETSGYVFLFSGHDTASIKVTALFLVNTAHARLINAKFVVSME